MRAVLKAMYQYAKLNEYIDRDLTEGLVYEWTNSTEQIHDRYSDEEIKTLWSKLYEINKDEMLPKAFKISKNECIPPVYHLCTACI